MDTIDTRPRRVWFGTTVPGKKMVRAMGADGIEAGRLLLQMYDDPPHSVLLMVGHALRSLPAAGSVGPAAKDLRGSSVSPEAYFYGAVLTDVRDFLKLRFRANGIPGSALTGTDWPREGDLPGVVRFTISALDELTRFALPEDEFYSTVRRLRDLVRDAAKAADPRLDGPFASHIVKMYEEDWDR